MASGATHQEPALESAPADSNGDASNPIDSSADAPLATSRERSFASLSLVIPTYNEAESLAELHRQLTAALPHTGVPFELIFVDDGSSDDTPSLMRELCARDTRVKYVRLRRNFGKAAALATGFQRATGDVIVTMDADLQDDPTEVEKLLAELDAGHDLVSGWKYPRLDPITKTWPSKLFNWAVRKGSGLDLHDMNCGLKAYRRECLDNVQLYGDLHRYIPVLADAAGFKVTETKVSHRPRQFGHSKYSVGRFMRGFLDFITVLFLTRYRTRPLHIIGGLAALLGLLGFLILAWLTVGWIAGNPISGRPLFFLGILLLIVSIQLTTFGLLAEMVTSYFRERDNAYPTIEEHGFGASRGGPSGGGHG